MTSGVVVAPVREVSMPAWVCSDAPGTRARIRSVTRPVAVPGPGEVLVRVAACGVCRTDLHLADRELAPRRPDVVPGHEGAGDVIEVGSATTRFRVGDRVGIAWLRHTCGECRWCRSGAENLCPASAYTGWDADGCYAPYAVVPAAYAYRLPPGLADDVAAPLLCAGIIGYRALTRAALPPGGTLGIYGFGASAHLTAQIAIAQGAEVHVLTRGADARRLALELGAASVGEARDLPPVALDAAITFAPAGDIVPVALEALDSGGTLVVAGIHLSDVPALDYARHLFRERRLTSVTANTRADGESLLRLADALHVRPRITRYPMSAADAALDDLATGRVTGAAVLVTDGDGR
jgi:propanol-preferring alcohol dehydrogenase